MSVLESLTHAGLWHKVEPEIVWVNAETVKPDELARTLRTVSGIVVPGGFGARGTEGKVAAARWARENRIPYLGLCYGLHMAVIDVARNVLGLSGANSTEIDPNTPYPVIDLMPDQKGVEMGGTMRLGLWPCRLQPGTKTAAAYAVPGGLGAPPAPLRGQQLVPRPACRRRVHRQRRLSRWPTRRDHGAGGPSLFRRSPVPPGVPLPADQPPPALPGLHRRRQGDPSRGRPARAAARGRG